MAVVNRYCVPKVLAAASGAAFLVAGLVAAVSHGGAVLRPPDNSVTAHGAVLTYGPAAPSVLARPLVAMDVTTTGHGYWLLASDGGVFAYGDARFYGSAAGHPLPRPAVGIAADRATGGYWLVTNAGAVYAFHAPIYGSLANRRIARPIVGIAGSTSGHGYWLVGADGGVFAFGDARFHGSTGNLRLAWPVVGMAADRATGGYGLAAADGGIFSFRARFYGSGAPLHLQSQVVGVSATASGHGYRLATADGGVSNFGDARDHGSDAGLGGAPTVAIAGAVDGYWLVHGAAVYRRQIVGWSVLGRPIVAVEMGNPAASRRLLVVAAIHGDEVAGLDVVRALEAQAQPADLDLWLVEAVDPDGVAARSHLNAHGVNLNRNFPYGWTAGGRSGDWQYPGPWAASEPETRAVMALVQRLRPQVTVWFHQQPAPLVDESGGASIALEQRYAQLVGLPLVRLARYPGSGIGWENRILPGTTAFAVEIATGTPSAATVERHVHAVLALLGP